MHRRGEGVHRRGEGVHRRGEGVHRRGEGVHRRGEGVHRRGEGVHRRGELTIQLMAPLYVVMGWQLSECDNVDYVLNIIDKATISIVFCVWLPRMSTFTVVFIGVGMVLLCCQ